MGVPRAARDGGWQARPSRSSPCPFPWRRRFRLGADVTLRLCARADGEEMWLLDAARQRRRRSKAG